MPSVSNTVPGTVPTVFSYQGQQRPVGYSSLNLLVQVLGVPCSLILHTCNLIIAHTMYMACAMLEGFKLLCIGVCVYLLLAAAPLACVPLPTMVCMFKMTMLQCCCNGKQRSLNLHPTRAG